MRSALPWAVAFEPLAGAPTAGQLSVDEQGHANLPRARAELVGWYQALHGGFDEGCIICVKKPVAWRRRGTPDLRTSKRGGASSVKTDSSGGLAQRCAKRHECGHEDELATCGNCHTWLR